jgi:transcriptional regulator with XRE-family HTH domain
VHVADQFATVVRRFRLRAGLTQDELARRSGVSVSTIRGMETGERRNPQLTSVRQLAAALGLAPPRRAVWEEALELYRQQGRADEASLLEKRLV